VRAFRVLQGRPLPASATLVEFHNAILDHYFMTADPSEAAGIDSGSAGPGLDAHRVHVSGLQQRSTAR
jgi:hypothetical protein